ncbi:hypothetical protein BH10PSE12_BH10PSE12_24550 [soil metagenome]
MPVEAFARVPGVNVWGLAALADRAVFDRHIEMTATAIADRFTLKVHRDLSAQQAAYAAWIASLQDGPAGADHRRFVRACADLIASLASERLVTYSAMMRDATDPMIDIVLAYPTEVTALSAGAALYSIKVAGLTGRDPATSLSPFVVENAAALLRRHPHEAALRFRELLLLTTPWN